MITNHSNPLEAWLELATDHDKLKFFRGKRKKLAMSMARKADVYPYFETVDYTPPATNNTYKIFWRTDEVGSNSLETVSGQYLPVQDSKGKNIYLYSPETSGKVEDTNAYLWVITPHFQSRYRERAGMKPVVETTELVDNILRNVPGMVLTVANHEKVNRNVHRYQNKVDDKTCNCYIPMRNGIAFIDETIYENTNGRLPKNVYIIEMRTFVNTEGLTPEQREAISKDIKDFFDKKQDDAKGGAKKASGAKAEKKAKAKAKEGTPAEEIKKGLSKLDKMAVNKGADDVDEESSVDIAPVDNTAKYRQDMLDYARRMVKKHKLHIVGKDGKEEILSEEFLKGLPVVPLDRELRRSIEMAIVKYAEMKIRTMTPEAREFTEEEINDILMAKASGRSPAYLAATYHTNTDVIRRILDENDAKLKKMVLEDINKKTKETTKEQKDMKTLTESSQFTDEIIQKMLDMHKDGMSNGQIAKKIGSYVNKVDMILRPYIRKEKKEAADAAAAAAKEAEQQPEKVTFTEQQVAEILLQRAEGDECKVIAGRFGAKTEDIVEVINANPERLANITKTLTAEKAAAAARAEEEAKREVERAEIISMYTKEGATIQEITSIYDRSFRYVKKILTDAGIEIVSRRPGGVVKKEITVEMAAQIMELRQQGMGTNKIATKTGLSSSTIYYFFQRNEDPLGSIKLKQPTVDEKAPELPFTPEEAPVVPKEEVKTAPATVKETAPAVQEEAPAVSTLEVPVASALDAFSVAEIFRHLYSLGYYIPDGKVNFKHDVEVAEDDEMIANLRKAGYNIDPKTVTRTVVDTLSVKDIIEEA